MPMRWGRVLVRASSAPEMGGNGVGTLVAVLPLKAQRIPKHAQVTVGVDVARGHMAAPGIDDLAQVPLGQPGHLPHRRDPSSLPSHEAALDDCPAHGVDNTVDDDHAPFLLL